MMATEKAPYNINKRAKDDMSDDENANIIIKEEEKMKWLLKCIQVNELFRDLNATQKRHIVLAMKLIETKENEIILKQHSVIPQTVYIVEDGEFFAIIDGMRVRSWIRGGIFGELALLYDAPRAATIQCISNIGHLWELNRTIFQDIINKYENIIDDDMNDDDDDDLNDDEFADLMISPMIKLKKRSSIRVIQKEIKLKSRAVQQKQESINYNEDDEKTELFGKQSIIVGISNDDKISSKDPLDCIQFKRIGYILSKYGKNEMGDSKYLYLNGKLSANYNNSRLYDDFYYMVNQHGNDYDFEVIYNLLISCYFNDIECDINLCDMFKRNMRDRDKYEENVEKYYNKNMDINEIMTVQLLDKIHCYFLHSYHQNHRLRNDELINDKKDDLSHITNIIRGRREKEFTRIHNDKYNMETVDKYKEDDGDIDDNKKDENNKDDDMIYSFGLEYWYWDKTEIKDDEKQKENENRLIIPQKYGSIKDELLNNNIHSIKKGQWDILYVSSSDLIKMEFVGNIYKADWNNRGIKRGEIISKSHLISLMVYCNYDILQRRFTETYRKMNNIDNDNNNDSNNILISRHSNFYNMGRLLYESINIYGKSIKDYKYKQFYHGISNEMMFGSPKARIYGPLSTTISITVAIHFSHNDGLVVTLQGDEWEDNKYFDMSWISEYASESECFFIGGLLPLRFKNILNTKTGVHYKNELTKFNILFNKIFNGIKYKFDGIKGEKEKKIIENLINKRLNTLNLNNNDYKNKDYIYRLFDFYCNERDYLSINYPYFQQEFDIFFDTQNIINLDDIFKLFPNLKHLKIDYVELTTNGFMECLLESIPTTNEFILEKIQLNWPKFNGQIENIISQFNDKLNALKFNMKYNKKDNKLFIQKKLK